MGTVYRNLSLLSELGEIQKLSNFGGADHFDGCLGPRVEAVAGDVESLCRDVAERLRSDGLSDADGDWLVEHGPSVQARIETPELQEDVRYAGIAFQRIA